MSDRSNLSNINILIDEDFKRRVRIAAAKRGVSMSEYARLALKNELRKDSSHG